MTEPQLWVGYYQLTYLTQPQFTLVILSALPEIVMIFSKRLNIIKPRINVNWSASLRLYRPSRGFSDTDTRPSFLPKPNN
ncbi:hypothetical protein [Aggregatibacter actinomycetemcomitans]|uniref:hypothetical protein n=1 Tax=Aggregatibacter actinomycetemcomitans TaxID=714 RepID=UPI00022AB7AE|nr:hypothetical protein [Aggregatibacter actinomycetemcomitans]MBN6072140.1 hypothetical protein [Aggregatibacter actinomycetemcomitans]MBN6072142.1 hypothetical protein [Aggregatibacter actinomycetemcomitans]MBN6072147.1 hypothetical protein [Aggregatibacter actinomycetemcomitans]MBN6072266.1 hypothetical protein [Aggregatibacter actinomycetemcomitans]OZV15153.1 hypothetical protein RO04_10975 [Aggregatibacter actinomycetemcomitans]